jgi:DNA-binding beta-propeller fold protein YncE
LVLVAGLVLAGPASYAQASQDLSAQVLNVAQLPGFLLELDEHLGPADLVNRQSPYTKLVAGRGIHEGHGRLFVAFDENILIEIRLVDYYHHRWAAAPLQKNVLSLPGPVPPGVVATVDSSPPGLEGIHVWIPKGRERAELRVDVRRDIGSSAEVRHRLLVLTARVTRSQYAKMRPRPDVAGAEEISLQPMQYALMSSMVSLILTPLFFLAFLTAVRDPSARKRLLRRFRPARTLRPFAGAQFIDVSAQAGRRLRNARLRTALRVLSVLSVLLLTFRMHLVPQILVLAGLAFALTVAEGLRARFDRRTGFRSAPYGAISLVIGVLGVALSLVLASFGGFLAFLSLVGRMAGSPDVSMSTTKTLTTTTLVAGALLMTLSPIPYGLVRRLWLRRTQEIIRRDGRPPVLFLRSWADDQVRIRARRTGRHALLERLSFRRWDRFEEIMASALWRYGPVVGLGEPGTRLPPLGAAREFHTEGNWQAAVAYHIDHARLVVMTVGRTASLAWEMNQIKAQGALGRTMFLIPPVPARERAFRQQVLCTVLGLSRDALLWAEASDRQVLLVAPRDRGTPLMIVSDTGDDVSYEEAIEIGAGKLLASGADEMAQEVAGEAAPLVSLPMPPSLVGLDQLLVSPGRGRKRAKPWYLRWWALGWILSLSLSMVSHAVDAIPGSSQRPAVPRPAVVSGLAPMAAEVADGNLIVLDARAPALVDIQRVAGKRLSSSLPAEPRSLVVQRSVAYVTLRKRNLVTALALGRTGPEPLWRTNLEQPTSGLAVWDRFVFVALPAADSLAVLDGRNGKWIRSIHVGRAPIGLAVTPGRLFVVNSNGGTMSVVRLPGFQVVKTVAVGMSPRSIAVNGHQIFVTDVVGQKIAVLQRHRLTVTRWIPVPRLTAVIAVNGRYIAASFTESGDWAEVAILDTTTGQVLRRIPLPTFAVDISVDGPDFLVSLLNANAVIKLHPTSA